ncbi:MULTISPECIES: hypothetical protein [Holzapfeliella]
MSKLAILQLSDEITDLQKEIVNQSQSIDLAKLFKTLDDLKVLNQKAETYVEMTQDDYYQNESDHRLTLEKMDQPLASLSDRILTNHVDGLPEEEQLNFDYNHEAVLENDKYDREMDFHVLSYSLKVISAAAAVVGMDNLSNALSKDAIVSIILAAHNLQNR